MSKNKGKNILNILEIVLLILTCVACKFLDSLYIYLIPFVLWIILIIIDRIYWKCDKCGQRLPNRTFFNKVICCPYCKKNVY